jgi:hypothetical protein
MNRVHPDSIPRLRIVYKDELTKPKLVRQTNEHERLPQDLLLRWWNSTTEGKKNIWMEYDAITV